MQAIQTIYDDNHQIYGAPKIAKEMQKKGEKISQRTVGVYMREWVSKPVTLNHM